MFLDSFAFWIVFVVVIILLTRFPNKRLGILLITSLIFHALLIKAFLIILLTHSFITYWFAQRMHKHKMQKGVVRLYLIVGIVLNIVLFVLVKYAGLSDIFNGSVQFTSLQNSVSTDTVVWIGVSFYILRSISFLLDVYRKKIHPVGNLTAYFLYILFFPLTIAGPIEKAHVFIRRFKRIQQIGWSEISLGGQLILWGLFKKAVIADNLGFFVKEYFNNSSSYNGLVLLIGIYIFSFQIYFDFSGYSDIASGLSYALGFSITQNFKMPYGAQSVVDFWKRWHISLTNWLREYIYIPFGGNRVVVFGWIRNIAIVFFISGLWHGLKITFLLWAMLHAITYIITSYVTRKRTFNSFTEKFPLGRAGKLTGHYFMIFNWRTMFNLFLSFNLVSLFWLPFRSDSLSQAWFILSRIVTDILIKPLEGQLQFLTLVNSGLTKRHLLMWVILIVITLCVEQMSNGYILLSKNAPTWLRWSLLYVIIIGLLFYSRMEPVQFIYAQF